MPATFDSFGVKFLYPDNWTLLDRAEHEDENGTTLELPSGGFFTIERVDSDSDPEVLIDEVAKTLQAEYNEIEKESIQLADAAPGESAADVRFYYLDLVVVSRVIVIPDEAGPLLIQFQAEIRDFDANEKVLDAILAQVRKQAS